ncbi:hypothetical protein ON010_g12662 [Phytophthora cinnamomi]|nr:hypothetical protein ON010_g12662 [Phytophthora cinnamomi]
MTDASCLQPATHHAKSACSGVQDPREALINRRGDKLSLDILVLPAVPLEPQHHEEHVQEAREHGEVHGQLEGLRGRRVASFDRCENGLRDCKGPDNGPDAPQVPSNLFLLLLGASVHGLPGNEAELINKREHPRGHGEVHRVPGHQEDRDQRVVRDARVQRREDAKCRVVVGQVLVIGGGAPFCLGAHRDHVGHAGRAVHAVAGEEDEEEPAHAGNLQVPGPTQAVARDARGHAREPHGRDGQRRPDHGHYFVRLHARGAGVERAVVDAQERPLHSAEATQAAGHRRRRCCSGSGSGMGSWPALLDKRERLLDGDRVQRRRRGGAPLLERRREHLLAAAEHLRQHLVHLELGLDLRDRVLAHSIDDEVDRHKVFVHDQPVGHALGHEDLTAIAQVADLVGDHFGRAGVDHLAGHGVDVQDQRSVRLYRVVDAHPHAKAAEDEAVARALLPGRWQHAVELLRPAVTHGPQGAGGLDVREHEHWIYQRRLRRLHEYLCVPRRQKVASLHEPSLHLSFDVVRETRPAHVEHTGLAAHGGDRESQAREVVNEQADTDKVQQLVLVVRGGVHDHGGQLELQREERVDDHDALEPRVDRRRDELALDVLVLPAPDFKPHDEPDHAALRVLRVAPVGDGQRGLDHGVHDDGAVHRPGVEPDLLALLLGAAVHGLGRDVGQLEGEREHPERHGEERGVPEAQQRRGQGVVGLLELQHRVDAHAAVAVVRDLALVRAGRRVVGRGRLDGSHR